MTLPLTAQSDPLGRYYTSLAVSRFLVDQIAHQSPACILDLGSGSGALSLAAAARWQAAQLLTVDVDQRALPRKLGTQQLQPQRHRHLHTDALSPELPKLISASHQQIHVAICNPPFITPAWRKGFGDILEAAGLSGCLPRIASADAALLFLAQNLRLLASDGVLGIIVPDSLVSAAKYRAFRKNLLTQYHVGRVIRLPRHSFAHTDAQAHILLIGKAGATTGTVPLGQFELGRRYVPYMDVPLDAAIDRLDYGYHVNQARAHRVTRTIANVCIDLCRGSLITSQREQKAFPVLHTTDMTVEDFGRWCSLRHFGRKVDLQNADRDGLLVAEPGDILIARVGRNLHAKVMGVRDGYPVLTDCVFRLRVEKAARGTVLAQLASARGAEWLAARAYGVSARQVTKPDILEFPLE